MKRSRRTGLTDSFGLIFSNQKVSQKSTNRKLWGVNMKKKILKAVLGILICWGIFVAIEGFRLIGSTDPGKCPLITLGSTQTADEMLIMEVQDFHKHII